MKNIIIRILFDQVICQSNPISFILCDIVKKRIGNRIIEDCLSFFPKGDNRQWI